VAEAIACWEKAVTLDPANAIAHRNLGYAFHEKDDHQKARRAYEGAVKADPTAALAIYELEEVYVDLGLSNEEIIAFLEKHIETVSQRDQALKRLVSSYVQVGRYNDALKWLYDHHFKSWEGRYGIHQYWVESHIKQGDIEFEARNYEKALEHYRLSLEYPPNLEVAAQPRTIYARKRYKVAVALEALGRKKEAREMFKKVAADQPAPDNAYQYYVGKALEKLGKKAEARRIYEDFLAAVDRKEASNNRYLVEGMNFDPRRNPQAILCFKRSLALEGLGRQQEAEVEREKAIELDPIVALRAFSPRRAGW